MSERCTAPDTRLHWPPPPRTALRVPAYMPNPTRLPWSPYGMRPGPAGYPNVQNMAASRGIAPQLLPAVDHSGPPVPVL